MVRTSRSILLQRNGRILLFLKDLDAGDEAVDFAGAAWTPAGQPVWTPVVLSGGTNCSALEQVDGLVEVGGADMAGQGWVLALEG
jgi:hypothetical protein